MEEGNPPGCGLQWSISPGSVFIWRRAHFDGREKLARAGENRAIQAYRWRDRQGRVQG